LKMLEIASANSNTILDGTWESGPTNCAKYPEGYD
jgi:hypothetical protein